MDHGRISADLARRLKLLRSRIDVAKIPSSSLDEQINLATWNIREFGRRRRRKDAIHFIAEVLSNFDVIAITEVRDNLSDLERVMSLLGNQWQVMFSDFNSDRAGNRERMAYLYDTRAVTFTGLAAELDPPKKKVAGEYRSTIEWWRTPYMASFRAGGFDFIMISVHIRWGSGEAERVAPLKVLADWIDKRRKSESGFDKDIILLGDFNIPGTSSPTFKAITSKGLRVPTALQAVKFTNLADTLAKGKRYDQILHYPKMTKCFTNRGGVVDYYAGSFNPLFPGLGKLKSTYQLSDHLPLWIQVDVDTASERLDQIISRADD
jgi:endonuclease/exonuclease/phosphatase family metal-dependent hydrolase